MNIKKRLDLKKIKNNANKDQDFDFENFKKTNLSEIMQEKYFKTTNDKFKNKFIQLYKYTDFIELKLTNLKKEISSLKNINKSLMLTQKYKEKSYNNLNEYNIKLKCFYHKIKTKNNSVIKIKNFNNSNRNNNRNYNSKKDSINSVNSLINDNNKNKKIKNTWENLSEFNLNLNYTSRRSNFSNSYKKKQKKNYKLNDSVLHINEDDRLLKTIFKENEINIQNIFKSNKKLNLIEYWIKDKLRFNEFVKNVNIYEINDLFESIQCFFVF